jgi:hypothetical protein
MANDYVETHTYEQLANEFRTVYPFAIRAFELVPMMYDRLTLVDGLSHKEAFAKIVGDHKDLSGFKERNIRRYLPLNNPNVPHRLRTSRPKDGTGEQTNKDDCGTYSRDVLISKLVQIENFLVEKIEESQKYLLDVDPVAWEEYQIIRKQCEEVPFPTTEQIMLLIEILECANYCDAYCAGKVEPTARAL